MKLSPGDTIQILLTVGGVPYAKTHTFKHEYAMSPDYALYFEDVASLAKMGERLTHELVRDIATFADEPALGD